MNYEQIKIQIGSPADGDTLIAAGAEFTVNEKELTRYNVAKVNAGLKVLKAYRASRGIVVAKGGKK